MQKKRKRLYAMQNRTAFREVHHSISKLPAEDDTDPTMHLPFWECYNLD